MAEGDETEPEWTPYNRAEYQKRCRSVCNTISISIARSVANTLIPAQWHCRLDASPPQLLARKGPGVTFELLCLNGANRNELLEEIYAFIQTPTSGVLKEK